MKHAMHDVIDEFRFNSKPRRLKGLWLLGTCEPDDFYISTPGALYGP
ncbi:hypothetical protein THIOKS1570018 [Thiocapsa sp. KS1]|nr:hypothetical protein THIOKS1570018 [Thiocapsa sp. KS1]